MKLLTDGEYRGNMKHLLELEILNDHFAQIESLQ